MSAQSLFRALSGRLTGLYDGQEAKAIAYLVLKEQFGLDRTAVLTDQPASVDGDTWSTLLDRLLAGEPVQYVLGRADFYGRSFSVTPAVLIPRPETEELVHWALQLLPESASVVDLGTGSGCIAVSVAAERPDARVEAWDISQEALTVAKANAAALTTAVGFHLRDMLDESTWPSDTFDAILSNPPYVKNEEAAGMLPHVLDHEPHLALFVEDNDPLLFYRSIARFAAGRLRPSGFCLVEINQALGPETAAAFTQAGFSSVEIRKDLSGRDRMILARHSS